MKPIVIFSIVCLLVVPQRVKAQNDSAGVSVASAASLTIGSGLGFIQQMKELAELTATQWLLTNHPEHTQFSLETLDFFGKKITDMSTTSVITFRIQDFDFVDGKIQYGKKFVLFAFTSYGWVDEFGINFDNVQWFLVDADEWLNMMTSYSKVASGIADDNVIREALLNGKVVNRGIRAKRGKNIDFHTIGGDMYLVTDYSDAMRFVYNERSLGIYLKDTMDLIQIGRGDIIKIHEYFFEE